MTAIAHSICRYLSYGDQTWTLLAWRIHYPLRDYVTLQEIGVQITSLQIMDIALQHFINHEMHLFCSQTGNVSKINFCSHSILANWKFFIQIRFKVFFNANDVKKDPSNFGRHWIFKWNSPFLVMQRRKVILRLTDCPSNIKEWMDFTYFIFTKSKW